MLGSTEQQVDRASVALASDRAGVADSFFIAAGEWSSGCPPWMESVRSLHDGQFAHVRTLGAQGAAGYLVTAGGGGWFDHFLGDAPALGPARAERILRSLCRAMEIAHPRGRVARDGGIDGAGGEPISPAFIEWELLPGDADSRQASPDSAGLSERDRRALVFAASAAIFTCVLLYAIPEYGALRRVLPATAETPLPNVLAEARSDPAPAQGGVAAGTTSPVGESGGRAEEVVGLDWHRPGVLESNRRSAGQPAESDRRVARSAESDRHVSKSAESERHVSKLAESDRRPAASAEVDRHTARVAALPRRGTEVKRSGRPGSEPAVQQSAARAHGGRAPAPLRGSPQQGIHVASLCAACSCTELAYKRSFTYQPLLQEEQAFLQARCNR